MLLNKALQIVQETLEVILIYKQVFYKVEQTYNLHHMQHSTEIVQYSINLTILLRWRIVLSMATKSKEL